VVGRGGDGPSGLSGCSTTASSQYYGFSIL
jgi:hypothetical protein